MDVIMDMFITMRCLKVDGVVEGTDSHKKLFTRVISRKKVGSGSQTRLGGWISVLSPYTGENEIRKTIKHLKCLDVKIDPKYLTPNEFYGYIPWTSLQHSLFETPVIFTTRVGSFNTKVLAGFSSFCHISKDLVVCPVLEYQVLEEVCNPIRF